MSVNLISQQVEEYILYKRSLGYLIKIESAELRRFAVYTISIGHNSSLSSTIAIQWASLKPTYSRWYMSRRLETIRTFAKYICVFDSKAQIPPKGMFGKCHGKTTPYIYTKKEICILMKFALKLYSQDGLRCITISTAIGLLWVTGMRPSEVCNLMDNDIDLEKGLITVRETKFAKSRMLPLHKTTILNLNKYISNRNKLKNDFSNQHFFLTTRSQKLKLCSLEYAFKVIRINLLLDTKVWSRRPPRLYDIRHSFASNTILKWLKNDVNVNNKIIYLSTYLGHVKVADTYWYLNGTQELLQYVTRNFEKYFYGNGGVLHEK